MMTIGAGEELVNETTIAWDGSTASVDVLVPIGIFHRVLIRVDNTGNDDKDTILTFKFAVDQAETVTYQDWYDTASPAAAKTFTAVKSTARVYGPLDGFPSYFGGKIVVAGSGGNVANEKTTKIQVWSV